MKNDNVFPPSAGNDAFPLTHSDAAPLLPQKRFDAAPPFGIITHYVSPLGGLTLASDGEALTGLWFDGQKHFPEFSPEIRREIPLPVFEQTKRWLNLYFSGSAPDFTPPLRPCGTPFQETVWERLRAIPYGHTVTYGELASWTAERLGRARMSARAVGNAVGRNPVALLIPCHRVVGADGNLTGYAAGLDTKARLLSLERAAYAERPDASAVFRATH